MSKLTQLEQKDLKKFRELQHEKQGKICPILKKEFPVEKMTVDHMHKRKDELPSEDGKGLIRGVIEFRANSMEGKILKSWKRVFGNNAPISISEYLRNLADYLENPPLFELQLIHPKEKVRDILMKSEYNKIKKWYKNKYPNRNSFPSYPKNKVKSEKWKVLIREMKEDE